MTYECPNCGDFLDRGECPTCGWDKWDRDGDRRLVADGGETWDVKTHLEEALDSSEDIAVRFHVRAALQHLALREGRVGWRGTYGPRKGGVVD